VREQARFLEHISERPAVRRYKYTFGIVLPDFAVDAEVAAARPFQAGNRAQAVVLPDPDGPNRAVTPLPGRRRSTLSENPG
jgi:hypothetical protein